VKPSANPYHTLFPSLYRLPFICPWKTTEYQRYFYVNQGGGGRAGDRISASTWFVGEILP